MNTEAPLSRVGACQLQHALDVVLDLIRVDFLSRLVLDAKKRQDAHRWFGFDLRSCSTALCTVEAIFGGSLPNAKKQSFGVYPVNA